MKDIVIIANFTRDFSQSDNGRFNYLAKMLSSTNKVEIITTDFSHSKKEKKPKLTSKLDYKVTFIQEPGYKKNISIKRIVSHKYWGKEVYNYLKQRKKPDVIYCAIPSLTGAVKASKLCKENNIKFIIDIQDLWPEAFRMAFNIPFISDILFSPINYMANTIYKRADVICGVSETYVNRALSVNDDTKENHVVFLGTKLSEFDKYATEKPLVKKKNNEIWLGYCGSLSSSYDIKCVIDALTILKNKNLVAPKFIVMGDGEKKTEYEDYVKSKNIDVLFTGRLQYDKMCSMLKQCDIVVNPITGRSAASIINKHGDYASAGVPVINTQESTEYRALVEYYQMGFNCENSNSKDLADKIEMLLIDEHMRELMGRNARKCAIEKFDRDYTYNELINSILD